LLHALARLEELALSDSSPNTEEMALLWIDEAMRAVGYEVRPSP
jgi:hypothetical protein